MSDQKSMIAIEISSKLKRLFRPIVRLVLLLMVLISLVPPAFALNEGLQCVPYARAISGVEIYGDAHTWWSKAKGRYERGTEPRVGAVLSFKSHGASRLGHISAVRAIVDDRTILVSHANWSRINGKRGHIEDDVQVVDVSMKNDWSRVKVWYQPIGSLGGTVYPINGFIYPRQKKSHAAVKASIAKLIGVSASRVALAEYPNVGRIPTNRNQSDHKRRTQASYEQDKKEKKKARKAFKLEQAFLRDLEKKSKKEKREPGVTTNSPELQGDPIGDLLGHFGR